MVSALPGLIMLGLFYSLALHMRFRLGDWPSSIGVRGFPPLLVTHGELAWIMYSVLTIISLVMEGIPFLEQYHHWLIQYHFRSWILVFAEPAPWARIIESQCILVGLIATMFIVGAAAFQVRDIKS